MFGQARAIAEKETSCERVFQAGKRTKIRS